MKVVPVIISLEASYIRDNFFLLPHEQRQIHQHIFHKDAVASCQGVNHHMHHDSDELSVLNDARAARECGQAGTTVFNKKFESLKEK